MEILRIKNYVHLENIDKKLLNKGFIADLGELAINERKRVMDFLNGLVFFNGSIKKIDNNKFEIIVNKNENRFCHKNPYYEELDEKVKEGLEKKLQFDSNKYFNNVPRKKVLNEYDIKIDYDNILYITMDNFNHIILLTKDNKLYIDNVLYKENVKKVIEFTKTEVIFVLDNNEVEYYSRKNSIIRECIQYDKVLYTDIFLATLKNKRLIIYYKVTVADNCLFIEDETFDVDFLEIDDIFLKEEGFGDEKIVYLNMKINENVISSPFIVGKLS